MPFPGTRSKALWLIAAAVVVVLLAVFVAPNLRDARDRRAYRTSEFGIMANGLLLEVYKRRHGSYPALDYSGPLGAIGAAAELEAISDELAARYPWSITDGWGRPFVYQCSADGDHYFLASGGRGGVLDQEYELSLDKEYRLIDGFEEDVVMIDGRLARWRGQWCCNPDYQNYEDEELKAYIRRGALGG